VTQICVKSLVFDLEYLCSRPLLAWMHFESEVNDGSPSGFDIGQMVRSEYRSNAPEFDLPVYLIDNPENAIRIGSTSSLNQILNLSTNICPLCVHPQFIDRLSGHLKLCNYSILPVKAKASSSIRTAWILDRGAPVSFVKMHFPATIGRFQRGVRLYGWQASLENSRLLSYAITSSKLIPPDSFAILRETGGTFVEGDGIVEGFGHIEREVTPFPPRDNSKNYPIIPFFSLWAGATTAGAKSTLLARIVADTKVSYELLLNQLITPLLEGYNYTAIEIGLIPECNAQNLLWEMDPLMKHSRVVHRDMMGFFKDLTIGLAKCQESFPSITYHTIGSEHCSDTKLRRSFAFDFKLTQYVIDPLVYVLSEVYDRPESEIQSDIVKMVKRLLKWPTDYFPDDNMAYGYPKEHTVSRSNYVCIGTPRYR
jgi:hypothetical protein